MPAERPSYPYGRGRTAILGAAPAGTLYMAKMLLYEMLLEELLVDLHPQARARRRTYHAILV